MRLSDMMNTAGLLGSGIIVDFRLITSSTTITVPNGCSRAYVIVIGGGAGGASSPGYYVGGSSHPKYELINVVPGNTISITIGAGGSFNSTPGYGGNTVLTTVGPGNQNISITSYGGNTRYYLDEAMASETCVHKQLIRYGSGGYSSNTNGEGNGADGAVYIYFLK